AKFGRARNLGERVVGHADAGATSMAYVFKAFASAL
ncbi:MAG: DAK2 domain-containing protein, partial [Verrucomicrobia bacterium]|nr:DAK2 domain-containing protein [Verrucomicrobiota bacterium]